MLWASPSCNPLWALWRRFPQEVRPGYGFSNLWGTWRPVHGNLGMFYETSAFSSWSCRWRAFTNCLTVGKHSFLVEEWFFVQFAPVTLLELSCVKVLY